MNYDFINLRPMMKLVAEELKEIEFESVLELGCGYGENISSIEKTFNNKTIVGIDINNERIEVARKNTKAIIISGDINNIKEFKDKSFDIVYTNALFIMLKEEQIEPILKEMVRIAKKQIILIECQTESKFAQVGSNRTGANWKQLFSELGLTATLKKIASSVWGVQPWLSNGYIIKVSL